MKKLLLFLTIMTLLFSCRKQEEYTVANPTTLSARSGDDGHDDHDEDEGEEICCRFKYGQWTTCNSGYQVRSWTSNSTQCQPPLDSIQRVCASAVVQYFYYNTSYASLRIVCNWSGAINIYNSTDQITASLPFNAGNNWVNVSFLPVGAYTAKAFGVTISFTR